MLYVAILTACLISAPSDCRHPEFVIHGNGIPYGAAIEAQTRAAEWIARNPGYVKKSLIVVAGRGA